MPLSAGQAGDANLVKTGAHRLTYGGNIAGFTTGNVQLNFDTQSRLVLVNEYGQTPVDEHVLGSQVSVNFSMIERSLKILDIALRGLYPGLGTASARGLGRADIHTAQGRGLPLTMHPISETTTQRDITIRKLLLRPSGPIEFSDQDSQIWPVTGTAVIDTDQSDGELLILIREPTAGANS